MKVQTKTDIKNQYGEMLSGADVAQILGEGVESFYNRPVSRRPPSIRFAGGRPKYPSRWVATWIEQEAAKSGVGIDGSRSIA